MDRTEAWLDLALGSGLCMVALGEGITLAVCSGAPGCMGALALGPIGLILLGGLFLLTGVPLSLRGLAALRHQSPPGAY
jgi:hypothetical protein